MAKRKITNRNYFAWFIVFVSLLLGFYLLLNSHGIITYLNLNNDIKKLNTEIENTRTQIKDLRERIDSLRNGNYTIEKIAREKYFMLKPNEQVFSIEKDSLN